MSVEINWVGYSKCNLLIPHADPHVMSCIYLYCTRQGTVSLYRLALLDS